MEPDNEAVADLRLWVENLEALIAGLDELQGDRPLDFCENAMDAWQECVSPDTAPPPRSPAMLVIVETMHALAQVMGAVAMDQTNTPDVRDRMTRSGAQSSLRNALDGTLRDGVRWLSEKLPSDDEIGQRLKSATASFQELQDAAQELMDKDAADDAAATDDPYGAVLGYVDDNVDAAIIFTKLCSFTEEENARYWNSHEQIRRMIDSELLRHIFDESDRFCEVLEEVLADLADRRLSLSGQDAFDERRRKLRSALISFTSAVHSHKDQSIRMVREKFGRRSQEEQQVLGFFDNLLNSSFEYRWLIKMRDALLHGDINAFKIRLSAHLDAESEANVFMDRGYMLQFTKESREKWLKRRELESKTSDPSVLDMINAVQDAISELQENLDSVLYPNVAEDAETVRELISRFEGREGLYALQSGPGFTRRIRVPPYSLLAPRVLLFADSYGKESVEGL